MQAKTTTEIKEGSYKGFEKVTKVQDDNQDSVSTQIHVTPNVYPYIATLKP